MASTLDLDTAVEFLRGISLKNCKKYYNLTVINFRFVLATPSNWSHLKFESSKHQIFKQECFRGLKRSLNGITVDMEEYLPTKWGLVFLHFFFIKYYKNTTNGLYLFIYILINLKIGACQEGENYIQRWSC